MQIPEDNFNVEDLVCSESFQRYCLGTDLEDELFWKAWLIRLPHKFPELEEARRLVHLLNAEQGNRKEQLEQLKEGLAQNGIFKERLMTGLESEPAALATRRIRSGSFYWYSGIAAAILMAFILVYLFRHPFENQINNTYQGGERFSSGKALRKTIVLKDGTVITLARESAISLLKDFDQENRELWLNGEAFFDVKHDSAHPFIVHTAFNDIKVLGTSFNVKAYPASKFMETALIRGSVRIDSRQLPGYFVVLKPNQKLFTQYLPEQHSAAAVKKAYKISELKTTGLSKEPEEIQWIKKRLDIDNLPLSVIARKLQDWYGIQIVIADEDVGNYRYSGVFENETILKTLEALQLSYPFHFRTESDRIVLTK